MQSVDTIYALSSAPGRAGVAVVRVSGPKARAVGERMSGRVLELRRAHLVSIRDPQSGVALDRGVVVWFAEPHSFTGEDVVEFQVHGGRAVVQAVLDAVGGVEGCRCAEPGEFARRAFGAGKIDLAEAEGLADLIDAETEAQRAQALRQSAGRLSDVYEDWRARLIASRARLEAAIDFSDEEDVVRASMSGVEDDVGDLLGEVTGHLEDDHRGEIVRDGFRIVLAGAPNVGKSSLLNALARRDVAIVSPEAGTTRDVVEVRLDLGGYAVIVSDTAGLREARGEVEREGIARTMARVEDAELVLWLEDLSVGGGGGSPPAEVVAREGDTLGVFNKSDLAGDQDLVDPDALVSFGKAGDPVKISAHTGAGIGELTERIAAIVDARIAPIEAPVLTRARHREHLNVCARHLQSFEDGRHGGEIELMAEDLRLASHALGRITGRVDVEDVLDEVFGRFCIGK